MCRSTKPRRPSRGEQREQRMPLQDAADKVGDAVKKVTGQD